MIVRYAQVLMEDTVGGYGLSLCPTPWGGFAVLLCVPDEFEGDLIAEERPTFPEAVALYKERLGMVESGNGPLLAMLLSDPQAFHSH